MDFDFTFERIIPNAGNSITIYTNGSLNLPVGTTGQRPSTPITGMLRYNTTNIALEFIGNKSSKYINVHPNKAPSKQVNIKQVYEILKQKQ